MPTLFGSLANNFLVFCGLLVAGVMALVAVDQFSSPWAYAALVALILALIGGLLALLSAMCAVNLARRTEKFPDTPLAEQPRLEQKIARARTWSANWGEASFWSTFFASVSALVFVISYAAIKLAPHGENHGDLSIENLDGSELLSVSGTVTNASVANDAKGTCVLTIKTTNLSIHLERPSSC